VFEHAALEDLGLRFLATLQQWSSFLSDTWRVPSENGLGSAALRVFWGVVGDMAGNAYTEFWPDVKRRLLRQK